MLNTWAVVVRALLACGAPGSHWWWYHCKQFPLLAQLGHTWQPLQCMWSGMGRRQSESARLALDGGRVTGLIQQRNASRAFGAWYELQKRKSESRGNKSIKLIINDKSPALATKQCYLLYPEDGKMQSQQLWAQFNLLYVFCVHVLWVPLCLWPPRFQQWQEILPLLFTVLPSSSTLCSVPGADWLEGKRGMRFCCLICQQIATDGSL